MVNKKYLKNIYVLGLLALLITVNSCTNNSFETKQELISFITNPENGLVQTKKVNDIEYAITLRPTDLMAHQEGLGLLNEQEFELLREKYKNFIYLNLAISNKGKEVLSTNIKNRADYTKQVNQMVFHMGNKIHLFTKSKEKIPLLDYVYPRTYGMTDSSIMTLVFNRDTKLLEEEYFLLTIEDFGLNTGEVSFKIPADKVLNEPKLSFNSK